MKYLMLIYGNQEKWDSILAEEWPGAIAKQEAFNRKYSGTGELIGAYGLADAVNARLVRRQDGAPAVIVGPYLETKEYIASLYLVDCENAERAEQIAAYMPWADQEPTEVWPILHESPTNPCPRPARDPGQPARLADHRGGPAADGRRAQRAVPPPARRPGRPGAPPVRAAQPGRR